MGRHRFEDQIKEKLGPREIKPTEGSWDKLRLRLEAGEKTPKPLFWWIGIAATLAGGLLIAGFVFNNQLNEETPIADVPSTNIIEENVNTPSIIENKITAENGNVKPASSIPTEKTVITQRTARVPDVSDQAIADATVKEIQQNLQKEPGTAIATHVENEEIDKKVKEILATVLANEVENGGDPSDEIDALLTKAVLDLNIEKQNTRVTTHIDPEDLLFDVEMELEQSFREKVFEILKEGYLKAKTSIANRNYPN